MPVVSVIVPCYNHEKFLDERLKSIFAQTYDNFEVILLDDASKDDSAKILAAYASLPKVSHFVVNSENSGSTFKQWQKGISLSSGTYIWIAESDDVADNHFLEEMVKVLESCPSAGVSFCQSQIINEKGEVLFGNERWTNELDPAVWERNSLLPGETALKDFFIIKNIIPNASATVFRKTAFLRISNDDYTRYRYVGDWLVWSQMLRHSDLHFTPLHLNYFRVHKGVTRKRKSFRLTEVYFAECYSVIEYIKTNVVFSREVLEKSYNRLGQKIYSEFGMKGLLTIRGLQFCRRISEHDPIIIKRLLYIIIKKIRKKASVNEHEKSFSI